MLPLPALTPPPVAVATVVPTAGPVKAKICKEYNKYFFMAATDTKKISKFFFTVKSYLIRQTLLPTLHTEYLQGIVRPVVMADCTK